MIDDIFSRCVNVFRRIASLIFPYSSKVDSFELSGDRIIYRRGWFLKEELDVGQIVKWTVYPEQVVDVFVIYCRDGTELRWLDSGDSLQKILESIGRPKEWN
jgi:hypothetical protein